MMSGEVALWRAVLAQAIDDAKMQVGLGSGRWSENNTPQGRVAHDQARAWLRIGNRDFHMVCDLADVSPNEVLKQLL